MAATELDRRERNKARTRQRIAAAARRLFEEQGFTATTVAQIADAADVAPRTFFRYFEAKEDLLLPDLQGSYEAIAREFGRRPASEDPLTAYESAILAVGPAILLPGALNPGDPVLAGRLAHAFVAWKARLTDLIAARFGGTRHLEAAVLAGIAVATTRAAMREAYGREAAGEVADRSDLVRQAFAVARAQMSR